MVSGARAVPPSPRRAERAVVSGLCRLLPGGLRERQRTEWAGDLLALADSGAGARWRYLLGAALTLPALRAAARRAGLAAPSGVASAAPSAALLAQVLLFGLGWPVISWLVAVPVRYVLYDIPARYANPDLPFDPSVLWPTDGPLVVLAPLWMVVSLGAVVAVLGGPVLVGTVGLAGTVLGAVRGGRGRTYPLALGFTAAALFALLTAVYADWYATDIAPGFTPGVLGAAAVWFGATARGLTRRSRIGLVLVGLGAVAILAAHHIADGQAMINWFLD